MEKYPSLVELGDIHTYSGEWKTLLLDRNKKNRSTFFEWNVDDCIQNTARRYSPIFTMEDYSFQVKDQTMMMMMMMLTTEQGGEN